MMDQLWIHLLWPLTCFSAGLILGITYPRLKP